MKKFFFFDIDGTLRSRVHDNYSDSTLEALHLLRKNGHFVALATGRIQDDAKELAKELKKLDLTKIVVFDDELALRLKFYGIERGSSLILSSETITNPKHIIKIKNIGVLKAEFYIF